MDIERKVFVKIFLILILFVENNYNKIFLASQLTKCFKYLKKIDLMKKFRYNFLSVIILSFNKNMIIKI